MRHLTTNESTVIDQAINIIDSKLRIKYMCLNNVSLIKKYLRFQLEKCERELMTAFYLDTQLRLIEYKVVYSGTINNCPVSPREFVKDALSLNASAIILAHNHPSGDAQPNQEDIKATLHIIDALSLFEIKLIDHFIVGHNQINSLRELNLI
jgi:DNA repair protein RadC